MLDLAAMPRPSLTQLSYGRIVQYDVRNIVVYSGIGILAHRARPCDIRILNPNNAGASGVM